MELNQQALDELRALDPDGSAGLLTRIIMSYLSDAPGLMRQIQAAWAGRDLSTLARHAHALKSTSASLGATRVSELARELEMAGKNNAIEQCASMIDALAVEYAAAERLLRAECATLQGAQKP